MTQLTELNRGYFTILLFGYQILYYPSLTIEPKLALSCALISFYQFTNII